MAGSGGKSFQALVQDARVLEDIGKSKKGAIESRMRIYPRTASATIRLTPSVVADTYGAWATIIPAGIVSMPYHVIGIIVENQQGADTWIGQLSSNNPPVNDTDYLGEWKIKLGALASFWPPSPLPIQGSGVPVGTGLYGRVQSAAGTNWLEVSVALTRHIPVADEAPTWPTWPW